MLSWASYLFGGSSPAEPQQDDSNADPAMETDVAQTDKDSSWVVVEHSGNNQVPKVGITDLENLLIEHPSMSVYKRSGSAGEDSSNSESSNELDSKSNRSHAMSRQAPKRVRAVSARAELIAQVCKVKHAQKLQQKRSGRGINKKSLDKANKVAISDKRSPRTSRARNPSGQMNGRVPQRKQ